MSVSARPRSLAVALRLALPMTFGAACVVEVEDVDARAADLACEDEPDALECEGVDEPGLEPDDETAAQDDAGSCGCLAGLGDMLALPQDGGWCGQLGATVKSRQIVHENCGEVYPWCSAQYGCHFQASTCECGRLEGSVFDGYIMLDEWVCTVVPTAPVQVKPCVARPF